MIREPGVLGDPCHGAVTDGRIDDPELTWFRRGGGKLRLGQCWSRQHISPQSTLAQWDDVRRTMAARLPLPGRRALRRWRGPGSVRRAHVGRVQPCRPVPVMARTDEAADFRLYVLAPTRDDYHWVGQSLCSHDYRPCRRPSATNW